MHRVDEFCPVGLGSTRLRSIEVAAIVVLLCQHVSKAGLTHLHRLSRCNLLISDEGELAITVPARATAQARPALVVIADLLCDLGDLVDAPAAALGLGGRDSDRGRDIDAFASVDQMGSWMVQAFHLTDSRVILRDIPRRCEEQRRRSTRAAVAVPASAEGIADAFDIPLRPKVDGPGFPSHWMTPPKRLTRRPLAVGLTLMAAGLTAAVIVEPVKDDRLERAPHTVPAATSAQGSPSSPAAVFMPRQRQSVPLAEPSRRRDEARSATALGRAARPEAHATGTPTARRLEIPGIERPRFSPSYSSNGSALFFRAGRESSARMVGARFDEAGALVEVTALSKDGARNYHVSRSPDRQQVAFDSDRDGQRAVYVARSDGTDVRRVSGEGFAAVPTWSPDGGRLAFVRAEPDRPRVWNLWLRHLGSGDMRRLTSYRVGQMWGASWFPAGNRVAYSHETSLHVLDLTTGRRESFASPVRGSLPRTPAVSPQGDRIVFQVQGNGVWMLELADGSMRRILADRSAEGFTWHPTGSRLAYHSRLDGHWGIWVTSPPMLARATGR